MRVRLSGIFERSKKARTDLPSGCLAFFNGIQPAAERSIFCAEHPGCVIC